MNAEMIAALREIENERNISFESLLEALEAALISAYKRNFGGEANAIVTIDRQTGDYQVYHRRNVVADGEVTDPKLEIAKKEAGSRYEPGDFYDEVVTPRDFGRIAAQTAKQVIVQRIREAERDTVYNTYSAKLHDIVLGTVQRYEQRNMYVLLDDRKTEALLPFSEQVPRENYRINDRIRVYVLDVRKTNKGPLVVLSRAAEGLVQRLIEFQVPEIQDDIVEIMAIAREAGGADQGRGHLQAVRDRRGRRVPGAQVLAHRQRLGRAARREDRRHPLGAPRSRPSSPTPSRRPRCWASSCSRRRAWRWSPCPTTSSRWRSGARARTSAWPPG